MLDLPNIDQPEKLNRLFFADEALTGSDFGASEASSSSSSRPSAPASTSPIVLYFGIEPEVAGVPLAAECARAFAAATSPGFAFGRHGVRPLARRIRSTWM